GGAGGGWGWVSVVGQDRVGDGRRGREAVVGVDHHVDAVGAEHLHDALRRGLRERMRVAPQEERAVDALLLAIAADRLRDGQHVVLVEGPGRGGPTVPGGAEG